MKGYSTLSRFPELVLSHQIQEPLGVVLRICRKCSHLIVSPTVDDNKFYRFILQMQVLYSAVHLIWPTFVETILFLFIISPSFYRSIIQPQVISSDFLLIRPKFEQSILFIFTISDLINFCYLIYNKSTRNVFGLLLHLVT